MKIKNKKNKRNYDKSIIEDGCLYVHSCIWWVHTRHRGCRQFQLFLLTLKVIINCRFT